MGSCLRGSETRIGFTMQGSHERQRGIYCDIVRFLYTHSDAYSFYLRRMTIIALAIVRRNSLILSALVVQFKRRMKCFN